MTPEQLKASILQWAMEGKLVKQDPSDEPASVLLEKIKTEKEKLIKEGKIKKNKKLPPVKDDEKPFKIPASWEWVRLGNICNYIQRGKSPKYDKLNKDHPIIAQKCNQWSGISLERAKFLTEDFWKKLEDYRFVKIGDVLLNSTGLGTVGRVNILSKFMFKVPVDSHVTIIRSNKNIKSHFVLFYMMSPQIQANLDDYLSGSTKQKEFSRNTVLNLICPLPPLDEQKRIVAKIEKLMPLVDKYAEAYNRLKAIDDSFDDKLKQSILQYAMEGKLVKQDPNDEPASVLLEKIKAEKEKLIKAGKIKKSKKLPPIKDDEKPFDIPASWEWARVGSIVNVYTGLSYRKSDLNKKASKMIRILRGGNINGKTYSINFKDDDKEIANQFLKNNLSLKKGELLTPAVTSDKNLGKIAYVYKDFPNVVAGGFVFNLVPFLNSDIFSKYFMFIFSSEIIHKKLVEIANKSGQAFYNVSKTKLKNVLIPLPPFNEQKRIVAKIDELFQNIKDFN